MNELNKCDKFVLSQYQNIVNKLNISPYRIALGIEIIGFFLGSFYICLHQSVYGICLIIPCISYSIETALYIKQELNNNFKIDRSMIFWRKFFIIYFVIATIPSMLLLNIYLESLAFVLLTINYFLTCNMPQSSNNNLVKESK